jgi:hypothetical protein
MFDVTFPVVVALVTILSTVTLEIPDENDKTTSAINDADDDEA